MYEDNNVHVHGAFLDRHLHHKQLSTYQQLFSILIEEHILQSLLDVDSLLQVLQESVQVGDVFMNALEHLVETGQYLKMVLTKLLITILEFLLTEMIHSKISLCTYLISATN